MAADRLGPYRAKRCFDRTPEPSGRGGEGTDADTAVAVAGAGGAGPRFVVQKHDARRLHYDLRFEADGVLVSWAVPKGPSYDPRAKRLAVHVEDHPLDYETFEGVIPEAQYGSGTVIVWDRGTYRNLTERRGRPVPVGEAVRAGHLSVWLDGEKLRGGWSLTRTGRGGRDWLLVKRGDEHADAAVDVTAASPASVASGRTLEELAAEPAAARWSSGRATWVPPMLARPLAPEEVATVAGAGWQYERKLDGLRCLAVRNGPEVTLWSRNHLRLTDRFPGVVEALGRLAADNFTFDGELVAFAGGRTSFGDLQRPPDGGSAPVYCAFDLLHLLGRDTTGLPLTDRQSLLARTLDGAGAAVAAVERLQGEPAALLERARAERWEGIVAKREASAYTPGRGPDWRKVKIVTSQELVVVGWTDPAGTRTAFGALLVGYYDDAGTLHYAGKVGAGFDRRRLEELRSRLGTLAVDTSPLPGAAPAKNVHWVRPELVVTVGFSEWTADGRLRHPRFEALREDKSADEVRRELPR